MKYIVDATNMKGDKQTIIIDASSQKEVIKSIRDQGLLPVKVEIYNERYNSSPQVVAMSTDSRKIIGIIGCISIFIGVFSPIVSVPMMGNMNYFQNGKGDGVILIAVSLISVLFILKQNYKKLWFTGIGSLGFLLFALIRFNMKMSEMKTSMDTDLADNPFRGFADMAMKSVQLQWGWAVLILGAVMLISAAAMKDKINNN